MSVQINVAANQAALVASIQAGVQAYNQRFAQNNPINLQINARAFSQPLGRITGDVKDFEAALAASNARVIAFGASTAVLGGVIRSFKELASVTIDVEKNLADINRVFGLSTSQLQKFSTELFNVSKQTASSFDDASKAALEFSRQGLKAEETLQRTKDALTLTRLAGIGTANAVDALTSTVNGFAATGITTTQILNKLVAVEQDFAVGAGDLAEALSRTGQAAQEAGVSLDQLNALVTAAQQSTARGGAVIGNALKTIFTRLQRTDTLDQLEAFNISVRDVQGNILPAVTILENFAGAYKNLADAQRAQLSEQVAGVYQVNILKAIVNDLNQSQGVYAGALQRGASATNEAEIATAKLNKTLDALLSQTATSAQQLANNIGKVTFEPLARYGTEQLKSLVESMNEILEGEGIGSTFANGLLKGIRNVIAGPGAIAAFFTLFKLIQNSFSFLSQALPQIAGITTETQNRKNIESAILQIMAQQGTVAQALDGLTGNQVAQANLLLQTARAQTAEYQRQVTLAKQLAPQLSGQGVKVAGSRGLQVTRAGGYVPTATKLAEVVGAKAGGYSPGRVVPSPVGGVMNTAEDVKYVPGFAQPFINPPANSKAGRAHRQKSINRTGVDPYMFRGFIPNFGLTSTGTETSKEWSDRVKIRNNPLVTSKTNVGPKFFDFFVADINKKQLNISIDAIRKEARDVVKEIYLKKQNRTGELSGLAYQPEKLQAFVNKYEDQVDPTGLARTETGLKNINKTSGYSYAINQVQGLLGEAEAYKELKDHGYKPTSGNQYFDFKTDDGRFAEVRTRKAVSIKDILDKAILQHLSTITGTYNNTKNDRIFTGNYDLITPTGTAFNASGFIPNFAVPMTTASIPWFKKYSSKYKNVAGDTDVFKMGDFPTYGRGLNHEYAKKGNSAMLSYLHEDFVRSALNIALGSKKVIRPAEVGFKNKPVSDISNENDFDLLYKLADGSYSMIELKQDFKNISGSVIGFMNKKLENLKKENPELAKKVSSMIAISNRPKFIDPTGKNPGANFSEFEMAVASIVKDKYSNVDSTISAKLTKVTDGLLRRYEAKKNTTYGGFIPNFASPIMKGYAFQDGRIYNALYHSDAWDEIEGSTKGAIKYAIHNNKLLLQTRQPISDTLKRAFISKGVPESAFSPVEDVAGTMAGTNIAETEKMINNLDLVDIGGGYKAQLRKGIYTAIYNLKNQSYAPFGGVSPKELQMYGGIENFLKRELKLGRAKSDFSLNSSKGFIPNFGVDRNYVLETLGRIKEGTSGFSKLEIEEFLKKFGAESSVPDKIFSKNSIISTGEIMGKKLPKSVIDYIKGKSVKELNDWLQNPIKRAMFDGIFGFNFSNFIGKNSRFTDSKGFIPNFNYNDGALDKMTTELGKRGAISSDLIQFVIDLKNERYATGEDKFHREIVAKHFGENLTHEELLHPKYANTYLKGSYDKNSGKIIFYKSFLQSILPDNLFENKHPYIRTVKNELKSRFANRQKNRPVIPKTFSAYRTFHEQHPGPFPVNDFNKGFIPNFAYKQAVMSLEENMSGNKAIFDTKPFPHIRNSSQPTFSSAIADHGGLANAMSDSMRGQKAAGLMSKGFVPNFGKKGKSRKRRGSSAASSSVPPTGPASNPSPPTPAFSNDDIDRAISDFINAVQAAEENLSFFESAFGRNKLIKSEMLKLENALKAGGLSGAELSKAMTAASNQIKQQQGKFAKGLSSASTAISIAGPMIAGFVEQAVFGNKKRTEMTSGERQGQALISTGLSAVTTGAGIGAAFGPQGALIGGAIGGLVGLVSAIDAASLSLSELAEIDQEFLKKQQANSQAASGYVDSQKKLNDLIASGASSKDIEDATRNLALSFNEIKDVNLAQIFASTGGNVNKLQDELKKYNDQLSRTAAGKSALSNLQQGGGFFATTFAGGKTTAELGVKEPSEVAAELFKSSSLFKDPQVIELMKAGTNEDLIASVKRFKSSRVKLNVPGLRENAAQIAIAQQNFAKKFTDELFPDLKENDFARYQQEVQRAVDLLFGKSGEAIGRGLEKMGKLEASNNAIQKVRNAALQGFAEIFGKIENSIKTLSLQAAIALEKDSQINRVNSAINEFTTNFSESIESFVMNSLPEGPKKLGFTQFAAQRKYDDAIAKQQISAENFRLSQQKERNDFQKTREENITKLFKEVSLQSEQSAKFYQSDIYDKVKSGDLSGLSSDEVSRALTGKLIERTKTSGLTAESQAVSLRRGLKEKNIDLSNFDFSDKDKVGSLIETVGAVQNEIAATGGAGSDQTYLKRIVAKFQNSLSDLYNTQEFFTNKAKKQEYDAAIELARLEGDQFNQRMINAEKLFQVNQILEKAQLEATKTLSVERAKVDNANFMRMESMKNMSASIANNLDVSKAEGTRDINRLKRTLQDPAKVAGLGVSERSERQFKIQEQILKKERAMEDANINAEIQQRMLELAAERENTTALYNLSEVIERFAAKTLLDDLGGEEVFKEMQNNPYIGKSKDELDVMITSGSYMQQEVNPGVNVLEQIRKAQSYSPEQLTKFEAYKRTQASIAAYRSGNTSTATVDAFADRMSKANFNKMDRDKQMAFLTEERQKADEAGAIALSNTISRFQEQIKLRKEALDISRADVNEQVEFDKKIIRTNNSFAGRFKTSFRNLKYEGEEILLKLGGDLPRMFADGLVNGIKAAIRESDNLGEALMGIAGNFLDAISTAMMQSAVYSMLGSMGFNMAGAAGSVPVKTQKGGVIRAQSGMYISGTGSGDKYPALLENGEYVLNRKAVMAMGGPSELDKLNFSMAPRFASGGSFATELTDLKSMEEGMTTFGLENSKLYNELRDEQRAKQAEKRRKAAERRKMIAGIVGSIVGMAASFGLMKAAGKFNTDTGMGGSAAPKGPGVDKPDYLGYGVGSSRNTSLAIGTGGQTGGLFTGKSFQKSSNSSSYGSRLSDIIPAYAEGGLYSSPIIKKYGVGMQNGGMYGGSSNNSNTVNNNNATNSFNFNTTVNRDGTIQMGADSTSYKQQDVELSNNLNSKVYETVLDVIKQQQRFGGVLAGTRRPV